MRVVENCNKLIYNKKGGKRSKLAEGNIKNFSGGAHLTVYDFFIDFALASILILAGQLLRAKLSIFQRFFIPASMIAGFLGLLLGPNVLNVLPFSGSIGSYAGVLIIIVFTIVGINGFEFGKDTSGKEEATRVIGFQLFKFVAYYIQIAIPIAVTLLVIVKLFPQVPAGFGLLLASGFVGGHGTASAVGGTFASLGWADAMDLGMTFATLGILTGVFVGLAMIKIATKKGITGYIKDFQFISGDLRTGLVSEENRESMGKQTISSVSLDTLCFHLSIVLGVSGLGYLFNKWFAQNVLSGVPNFTMAYIIALIVFLVFRNTKVYDYVDKGINQRLSGTATDYLVFFGISSIKISIIIKYAAPLLIMAVVGIILVVLTVFPFGKMFNKDSWFERAMFVFGYSTGVFAIGFILLRIVDPDNYSKTIGDTAMTPLTSFLEVVVWSTIPALLMNGKGWLVVIVSSAIVIGAFVIGKITGSMWSLKDEKRVILGNTAAENRNYS